MSFEKNFAEARSPSAEKKHMMDSVAIDAVKFDQAPIETLRELRELIIQQRDNGKFQNPVHKAIEMVDNFSSTEVNATDSSLKEFRENISNSVNSFRPICRLLHKADFTYGEIDQWIDLDYAQNEDLNEFARRQRTRELRAILDEEYGKDQ